MFIFKLRINKIFKKLGAKNIKYFGNLKFAEVVEDKIDLKVKFKSFLKSKNFLCFKYSRTRRKNNW